MHVFYRATLELLATSVLGVVHTTPSSCSEAMNFRVALGQNSCEVDAVFVNVEAELTNQTDALQLAGDDTSASQAATKAALLKGMPL
jgi:hypothetical protein